MKRMIIYLAWAWEILIGVLLITPGGILCIACGVDLQTSGYIGRPATIILAIGAIALGIYGIVNVPRQQGGASGG